jgi:hypothetical protein
MRGVEFSEKGWDETVEWNEAEAKIGRGGGGRKAKGRKGGRDGILKAGETDTQADR